VPASLLLRPIEPADRASILALNEADVHHLSPLDGDRLDALIGWCAHAEVIVATDAPSEVLGFVLTVPPHTAYDSPNYRWFEDTLPAFLYLDRIVVAADARRRGVGSFVYDHMQTAAHTVYRGPLVCEVDVEPPNHASLRFHRARGFQELGRQQVGGKSVAYLASP
jgi:predicted GNAT superfamily acetyltransferase